MRAYRVVANLAGWSLAGVAQAQATATLLAPDLHEHCSAYVREPGSTKGAFCHTYIQGFLDGATSIDDRVRPARQVAPESWIERAQRTRLGRDRVRAPPYCIGEDEPLDQVINWIVRHGVEFAPDPSLRAHEYITLALRRFYPC